MSQRLVHQWRQKAVSVQQSCRVLGVSRSAYYAARRRASAAPCAITPVLEAAFVASGSTYGSRRLMHDLRARGCLVGRHRVRRLMRAAGIKPVWRRKFVHTTNSRHNLPVSDNVLDRRFNPIAPNLAWVSDITYVRTDSGWLYLAVVLELYSRKIIGWATASSMPAELVCHALHMAIQHRKPAPGLIVHSDRGSQYASAEHQSLLRTHRLIGSMSRLKDCWDNAVVERFFLNLKMERVWQRRYANHAEARRDIADYIVGFYNDRRISSKLNYLSPNAFEQRMTA
jgi:putative transposase